ncbi:helix-turn-helix transcriptional regulator [Streptomyces sp. NBC_00094]|uniref:helix-turn-helix transcriptional regulator n=1 Tax=Streptomyces sp. NBC_00094 TaxID=2903620 RepID=UPI00224E36B5|nr:helix-turn-helix transcriptional regulator [Streptomyces sp. NBC_00094]MCX5392304.1 LuxR C-terminal-related transcriptional regulator [Streptomyces sp. NBC_00094]
MSRNAAVARTGSEQALAVYQGLRARPEATFDEVADRLELSAEDRERCRDELTSLGLTTPTTPVVVDPDVALLRLLRRERDRLQERLTATSHAHTALEALAGPFLRAGATPRGEIEVEIVDDLGRVRRDLADLTDSVRTAVHFMHTGSVRREELPAELAQDRLWVGRGVRIRAMYSRRAASVPEMAQHLEERAALGVEVRFASVVPMNMVLADENFALLPTDPHDPSSPSILARGPGLVRSYLALYEYCWTAAAPYGEEEETKKDGDGLSEQQRAALLMLASGIKDEQIARNLGVSLRTVSRLLSEVMQELGAASRFEAGVKASRLGLLDGEGADRTG